MWDRVRRVAGVLFVVASFLVLPVAASGQRPEGESGSGLPEGKGKELVGAVCVQCHSLSSVTSQKKSKTEWEQNVSRMVANGAQASPDEAKMIAAYLGDNFGLESKPPSATGGSSEVSREAGGGLPEGPGKDVVMNKCFQCHAGSMWRDLRQDKKKWEGTLYRMVGKGALWTEEEIAVMAQYLGTAFGPKGNDASQKKAK